jgi:hypothetical protein
MSLDGQGVAREESLEPVDAVDLEDIDAAGLEDIDAADEDDADVDDADVDVVLLDELDTNLVLSVWEPTGEPRVDAALELLNTLDPDDVHQHAAMFDEIHQQLRETLSDADAPRP